jgi:hypothetical protein
MRDILLIIFLVFFICCCNYFLTIKDQMVEQTKVLQEIAQNIDTQNEIMKGGV